MTFVDRRERGDDLQTALLAALEGFQAKVWTALPCIVESFDPDKMTITAQPAIQARVRSPQGEWSWVNLPLLVDVPMMFPRAGGFTMTFPVTVGDEVLVHFASRCIDAWWQSGGIQVQADLRMHDLSDGFATLAPTSQPRVIPAISLDSVQLRNDEGDTFVEVKEGQVVNVVAPGAINLTTEGALTIVAASVAVTAPDGVGFTTPTLSSSAVISAGSDVSAGNNVSAGAVVAAGTDITLGGESLDLGGIHDALVEIKADYNVHTHEVEEGGGTSSVPTPQLDYPI